MRCLSTYEFKKGDRVTSLAYYPPAFTIGTQGIIGSPHFGPLYAVRLPSGELYRWFSIFELDPVSPERLRLSANDFAIVNQNIGHPSNIQIGTRVQIVKASEDANYYDLHLSNNGYHRWITWFDIF